MFGFFKKNGDGQDGLNCANVSHPVVKKEPTKEPEPAPIVHHKVDLKVKTTDSTFGWGCNKTSDDISAHYDEFVRWYHSGKTSLFVMKAKDHVTCFKRKDIIWYTIMVRPETEYEAAEREKTSKLDK